LPYAVPNSASKCIYATLPTANSEMFIYSLHLLTLFFVAQVLIDPQTLPTSAPALRGLQVGRCFSVLITCADLFSAARVLISHADRTRVPCPAVSKLGLRNHLRRMTIKRRDVFLTQPLF
jgi:hypothetical protein